MNPKLTILDCSGVSAFGTDFERIKHFNEFANKLGNGMRETGFVYFINYEMTPGVVENFFAKSREFFQLPADVKCKYKKNNPSQNFHGFSSAKEENVGKLEGIYRSSVPDLKEMFDFWGTEALNPNNYPIEVPGLKDAVDNFRSSLMDLIKTVSYAFAIYLKMEDREFFFKHHKAIFENRNIKSHNFLRSNYYFPSAHCLEDTEQLRLAEHCDIDTLSFLIQDEIEGLEAKMPNGDWIPVPPIKNSIVLNAGFMMEVWSGGHIPATVSEYSNFFSNNTLSIEKTRNSDVGETCVHNVPDLNIVQLPFCHIHGEPPNLKNINMSGYRDHTNQPNAQGQLDICWRFVRLFLIK